MLLKHILSKKEYDVRISDKGNSSSSVANKQLKPDLNTGRSTADLDRFTQAKTICEFSESPKKSNWRETQ